MQIRIDGYYDFTDRSNSCCQNGELSILYPVPKSWSKWSNERKQQWLYKNEGEIDKCMCEAMCIVTHIPDVEDLEEVE